jgi:hypothetical protein
VITKPDRPQVRHREARRKVGKGPCTDRACVIVRHYLQYSLFYLHVSRASHSLQETEWMHRGHCYALVVRTYGGLCIDVTIRRELLVVLSPTSNSLRPPRCAFTCCSSLHPRDKTLGTGILIEPRQSNSVEQTLNVTLAA